MPQQEDNEEYSITVQGTGDPIKDSKGASYLLKKSICFICLKPQSSLRSHLIRYDKHQDNEEVKKLRLTPKESETIF